MKEINWTDDDIQRVMQMKARGMTTDAIAEAMGKTPKGIYQMLYRRRRGDARKRSLFAWTEADIAELKRLHALGYTTRGIADAMGRTLAAVATKKGKVIGPKVAPYSAPTATIREWRKVQNLQHSSITAMLCGDPLPGRSALDRRGVA